MKNPSIYLRIASVLSFLFFAGHTSGYPWTPVLGPAETALVDAMQKGHFEVLGETRSYWDFYIGFGLGISAMRLMASVLLWQLAGLLKTHALPARALIAPFLLEIAFSTYLAWKHFFAPPLILCLAITVTLVLAFAFAGSKPAGTAEVK